MSFPYIILNKLYNFIRNFGVVFIEFSKYRIKSTYKIFESSYDFLSVVSDNIPKFSPLNLTYLLFAKRLATNFKIKV